ncbi:hypothetical protein AWC38_SpisGene3449 [Stylophora pistillata]|uniref:Uncharacterized protein n=1 Tax=Stylophora pistillata TaxID=50429 RepID=A0A2B4SM27_STYPI|nr:hypothetical protein AWC38_SpisGene3449 [Stylophora pistillata]
MKKSMVRLAVTAAGEEYFELNKEEPGPVLTTKNHTGGLEGSEDHADGKIFSSHSSKRCPVQTIKSYLSHLNPEPGLSKDRSSVHVENAANARRNAKENTPPRAAFSSSASKSKRDVMARSSPVPPGETSVSTIQSDKNVLISNGINPSSILPSGNSHECSFNITFNINK